MVGRKKGTGNPKRKATTSRRRRSGRGMNMNSNFTVAAIVGAVALAFYNIDSPWTLALCVVAIVAIGLVVSAELYNTTGKIAVRLIGATEHVSVALIKGITKMWEQYQLTRREAIKAQRAILAERQRGETWVVKGTVAQNRQLTRAQQRMIDDESSLAANAVEFDPILDAKFEVIENDNE